MLLWGFRGSPGGFSFRELSEELQGAFQWILAGFIGFQWIPGSLRGLFIEAYVSVNGWGFETVFNAPGHIFGEGTSGFRGFQ